MLHRLLLTSLDDTAARSVRATLDAEHVERLANAIRAGRTLPPVLALRDGDHVRVFDGAHRIRAYALAAPLLLRTLEIDVETTGEGGPAEALALALGCNREHGLPLSRADLQHRREIVLTAEEERVAGGAKRRSLRDLAAVVGCSHTFVGEWYAEQSIELRRRKPAPPVRPEPGRQLIGGGEVPTLAQLRDRLEGLLKAAERLEVEGFDLPGEPGQLVALWLGSLDDEPRPRLEAALVAVEAANARARFEAVRASDPHLTSEIACPTPAPLSSSASWTPSPASSPPVDACPAVGVPPTVGTPDATLPQASSPPRVQSPGAGRPAPARVTPTVSPSPTKTTTTAEAPASPSSTTTATTEAHALVHRFALSGGGERSTNKDLDADHHELEELRGIRLLEIKAHADERERLHAEAASAEERARRAVLDRAAIQASYDGLLMENRRLHDALQRASAEASDLRLALHRTEAQLETARRRVREEDAARAVRLPRIHDRIRELLQDGVERAGDLYLPGYAIMTGDTWGPMFLAQLEAALFTGRAPALSSIEGVDVAEVLEEPRRPWIHMPWEEVEAALRQRTTLARALILERAQVATLQAKLDEAQARPAPEPDLTPEDIAAVRERFEAALAQTRRDADDWDGPADDLDHLDDDALSARYREVTGQKFFPGWNRAKRIAVLRSALEGC